MEPKSKEPWIRHPNWQLWRVSPLVESLLAQLGVETMGIPSSLEEDAIGKVPDSAIFQVS